MFRPKSDYKVCLYIVQYYCPTVRLSHFYNKVIPISGMFKIECKEVDKGFLFTRHLLEGQIGRNNDLWTSLVAL